MFTLIVVLVLMVVFLFGALLHYAKFAPSSESFARNSRRLIIAREKLAEEWKAYAESLELENAALKNQLVIMQQSIYDQTVKSDGKQYTLPLLPKTNGKFLDPDVLVKGKLVKLSSLEIKPTNGNGNTSTHKDNTAVTTTTTTKTAEVSTSIAPQDDHEKNLVTRWQEQGKAAEWINSQLTSIQAGKAKRANAVTN